VKETTDGKSLPVTTFSKPIFSLMQMAARNNAKSKYLAIEENFLLAAIHVAALKDISFAEGVLPDLPSNMPSVLPGLVFLLT
jgi:hypothetical protein